MNNNNSTIQNDMETRLQPLNLSVFKFRDDSFLHAGHEGAKSGGGHYAVVLVSDAFAEKSRVQRQRMVHDLLADLFQEKRIHALSIVAKTPAEYQAS